MLVAVGGMYFTLDFIFGLIKGWIDGCKEDLIEFAKIDQVYRFPKKVNVDGTSKIIFEGRFNDHKTAILKAWKDEKSGKSKEKDLDKEEQKQQPRQSLLKQ